MNKIFLLILSICIAQSSYSQRHDFDSLMTHNKEFKIIAQNISDTLDLFNQTTPLEIILETDIKNLIKTKYKEEYQDATCTIEFNDTVQVVRELKIKARGNMRRKTCFIPPLKLNFPKKEAYIKQLAYFDKIKMVLDCKRADVYEQYLLSEYYAYKILNIITEYSLRVRLLKVTYIDLSGRFKEITKYAFIIESIDQLNERLNTVRIETKNIRDIRTDLKTLAEGYLFQYLIGNTDWSIPALHNIYLLKSKDPSVFKPYVIPFDFDYAGIVNANYAIPDKHLGIDNVRERLYWGVCITAVELQNARKKFINKKKDILALYENDKYLSNFNKNSTIRYVEDFYEIIENDNAFRREIEEACR